MQLFELTHKSHYVQKIIATFKVPALITPFGFIDPFKVIAGICTILRVIH